MNEACSISFILPIFNYNLVANRNSQYFPLSKPQESTFCGLFYNHESIKNAVHRKCIVVHCMCMYVYVHLFMRVRVLA